VGLAVVVLVGGGAWWKLYSAGGSTDPSKQGKGVGVVVPQPLPERMLQYYMVIQKFQNSKQDAKPVGNPSRLAREMAVDPDYRIRLVMSATEPGYLYVINEGPKSTSDKPDFNGLFPDSRKRDGSARLDMGQEESIPNEKEYLTLDNETGKEKVWLVWSAERIRDLDVIEKWVTTKNKGVIKDPQQAKAIYKLLREFAGDNPEAKGNAEASEDEKNNLSILRGRGPVLVRKIELRHVE